MNAKPLSVAMVGRRRRPTQRLAPEVTLAPDSSITSEVTYSAVRRSASAVDVLRTWRLAREVVNYNAADLLVVAPQPHEPAGLRVIAPDRSVDLIFGFDGHVWMHRPWKQLLGTNAARSRSLGTTRLLAAKIVRAAHISTAPSEASLALVAIDGVIEFLSSHPKGSVTTGADWVCDGAGLRSDAARRARWLWGEVPVDAFATGPLPELPSGSWFWIAVDGPDHIKAWWCQRPLPQSTPRTSSERAHADPNVAA